jgi:hypothetical protein
MEFFCHLIYTMREVKLGILYPYSAA